MSDLDRVLAAHRRDLAAQDAAASRRLASAWQMAVDHLRSDILLLSSLIGAIPRGTKLLDTLGRLTHRGRAVLADWRVRRLLAQAAQEFAAFTRQGLGILADVQATAAAHGATNALALVAAAGVATRYVANVTAPRLPAALDPASPYRATLDRYGSEARTLIRDRLLTGIMAGVPALRITGGILRDLATVPAQRSAALTMTTMMNAYRAGAFDQYARVGVERWMWVCELSVYSCLACVSMHGQTFSMDDPFMACHVRCHCQPVPVGDDSATETGADWFARQPAATQRAMMPSQAAFDAYQSGRLSLDDFRGMTHSRTWGPAITERSGAAAMEAATA